MNQSGIALYSVSAEGLQTLELFGVNGMDTYGGRPDPTAPWETTTQVTGAVADVAHNELHQAMEEMARRTGGRAYYNRNDLETGIRHALDDARHSYEIAYYPDHDDWKGEWRKIQVKVNRPGVTVLARGGYFAFPEPKLLPPKARKQLLEEIAASPLEATEIPITVKMTLLDDEASVRAQVDLNPQKLFINQIGGNWASDFEVLFFQLSEKNVVLDVTTQSLDLGLQQAKYEQALKRGINTIQELKLKPAASVLYVIVHDKKTDAVGSVRIPLTAYITKQSN